jgi:hypothetical protein
MRKLTPLLLRTPLLSIRRPAEVVVVVVVVVALSLEASGRLGVQSVECFLPRRKDKRNVYRRSARFRTTINHIL